MQSCTCEEYAAIGAQVRRQLLDALDSWAQEVQAAAEEGQDDSKSSVPAEAADEKLPARVARELSSLKAPGALARYRDKETGARLNPAAIAAETNRRIAEKLTPGRPKEHPLIRKTRERNARGTLAPPLKPAK